VTRYLLDSDTVISVLKGAPRATQLIADLYRQDDTLCTCLVVMAEVYSGLRPIDDRQADTLLRPMLFLTAAPDIGRQAGLWRYEFARRGVQLSAPDCLIAATAHYHRATLITGNTRHFPMTELATLRLPQG
jgi:predicted nucleic acid-binding protein